MSMTAKHTATPWKVFTDPDFKTIGIHGNGRNGSDVAVVRWERQGFVDQGRPVSEDYANARRIVACINACEGLDTDVLVNMVMTGDTLRKRIAALHEEAHTGNAEGVYMVSVDGTDAPKAVHALLTMAKAEAERLGALRANAHRTIRVLKLVDIYLPTSSHRWEGEA